MTHDLLAFGKLCHRGGEFAHAERAYRRVLEAEPEDAEALGLLGSLLVTLDREIEAISACRNSLRLRPGHAETLGNLGVALLKGGHSDEALSSLQEARQADPARAELGIPLADALGRLGRIEEAIEILRTVVRDRPRHAIARNDLGVALRQVNRDDEAAEFFRQAIGLDPNLILARTNLGTVLQDQGRIDEAIAHYEEVIRLYPKGPDAHWNRSTALLLRGDYPAGWAGYGWRWAAIGRTPPRFERPTWEGSPFPGRTVLLHAEQGLGDTLQFVRYARQVAERGGRVVLVCQGAVAKLVRRCAGLDEVVRFGEPLPPFDFQVALMDLPRVFGTTLESVPAEVPYLFAEPRRSAHWRESLGSLRGLKVGLAWQGRPEHPRDRQRSFPLAAIAEMTRIEGVRWCSLQHGAGLDQWDRCGRDFGIMDLGIAEGTMEDTAAVVANLDLLIAPDSAIAHLAGGLGVPTWLALPSSPDWRWLLGRPGSPWYPTLRLFRQTTSGDWPGVFSRMAEALALLAGSAS